MNSYILNLFKDFQVDGVNIPVEHLYYSGDSESYITFQKVVGTGHQYYDNQIKVKKFNYDFDVYTKGNPKKIIEAMEKILLENKFVYVDDGIDEYDEESCYYHQSFEYAIIKGEKTWQV